MAFVDLMIKRAASAAGVARYAAAVELCAAGDQLRMALVYVRSDVMAVHAATQRFQTAEQAYEKASGTSRSYRVTTARRQSFDLSDTGQL